MDSQRYVLACYLYIELNPVRAGMVPVAIECRWSSLGRNAHGLPDPRIRQHPAYAVLGTSDTERVQAYQRLFDTNLADSDAVTLRLATRQKKTWRSERFRQQIEALTKRELAVRPRGRPKKDQGKCT